MIKPDGQFYAKFLAFFFKILSLKQINKRRLVKKLIQSKLEFKKHADFDDMKHRCLSWLITIFCLGGLSLLHGCKESSPSDPDIDPIEPAELELRDVRFAPWVTQSGEPFTLEVIVRGVAGSELHLYTNPGVSIGPDGTITPNTPSGLIQNGVERDYLVLQKDEAYDENQVYLESRFTANNILLPVDENGVELSTVRNVRIEDPENFGGFNFFPVQLTFRSVDPAVIGTPSITQLDTDVFATSRVVNIISDEANEITSHYLRQVSQTYYDFFPDDRDFLIIEEPPNVDYSVGGTFYFSGEREKGLGDNRMRDPSYFGSAGQLKGVIQSLRGIYSMSATGKEDFCLLTHELLHRWAAYMGEGLASEDSHWSEDKITTLNRETSGFGYNESKTCEFNDFELYLAGFLPADSVSNKLNQNGYTMDDFISENGSRVPAYPETQRDFTIGFIVESEEALSDREMAYFHFIAKEVAKKSSPVSLTWHEATGGRSLLDSELPSVTSNPNDDSFSAIRK